MMAKSLDHYEWNNFSIRLPRSINHQEILATMIVLFSGNK